MALQSFMWFLRNMNCGWRQLYQPRGCSPSHIEGDSTPSRSDQSQDKPATVFGKGTWGVHKRGSSFSLHCELWGFQICLDDTWNSLSPHGLSDKIKLHLNLNNNFFLSLFFSLFLTVFFRFCSSWLFMLLCWTLKLGELESFGHWVLKTTPHNTNNSNKWCGGFPSQWGEGGCVCHITSEVNVLENIRGDSPFSQGNTACQKAVLFQR